MTQRGAVLAPPRVPASLRGTVMSISGAPPIIPRSILAAWRGSAVGAAGSLLGSPSAILFFVLE